MDFSIDTKIEFEQEITVEEKDCAASIGSGNLAVFATPAMIALMENSAMKCLAPILLQGWDSVGTEVNIKHIKATPVGGKIFCKAEIVKSEGKKITFSVSAKDEKGEIGYGTHTRYIINVEKFLSRI